MSARLLQLTLYTPRFPASDPKSWHYISMRQLNFLFELHDDLLGHWRSPLLQSLANSDYDQQPDSHHAAQSDHRVTDSKRQELRHVVGRLKCRQEAESAEGSTSEKGDHPRV